MTRNTTTGRKITTNLRSFKAANEPETMNRIDELRRAGRTWLEIDEELFGTDEPMTNGKSTSRVAAEWARNLAR